MMQDRRDFFRDPERAFLALEVKIKERKNWEPGESWGAEALLPEIPWGHNAGAARQYLMWSNVHRACRNEDLALIKGLVAQALKVTAQVAFDGGRWEQAWLTFPAEDPCPPGRKFTMPPSPLEADPFAGLCSPEEIAARMAYVRDTTALARARQERQAARPKPAPAAPPGDGGAQEETAARRARRRAKAKP